LLGAKGVDTIDASKSDAPSADAIVFAQARWRLPNAPGPVFDQDRD
jgi:hypothetical protein